MRKLSALFLAGVVALLAAGCAAGVEAVDAARAAKYKAAVATLPHVVSVESNCRTNVGMGRTGNVVIDADTDDEAVRRTVLAAAFPAIVKAADGDPEVSLGIQVVSASSGTAVTPEDLGYSGTGTLDSYRAFLAGHPELHP
ncbi:MULTISPECIES: hypothetical protein [Amycolatopsis]|uniref:Lipoprotein n=1 Tax=Amycolatopsis albidoflavus TaxID=102226 RepID=A0ABW5I6H3_9PSEU